MTVIFIPQGTQGRMRRLDYLNLVSDFNNKTIRLPFTLITANPSILVDVLENWETHEVVGVLGLDTLSKMTFILSHENKKFMLTDQKIPELIKLFA
jgi:hypothetical protein